MTKYVVIYESEQKGACMPDLVKSHVDHLRDLYSSGVLFLFGPLKNPGGKALLIFEVNSKEEAESYVLKDPLIAHKWYGKYHIYEWLKDGDINQYLG